jgi:hypothetical protein
MQLDGVGSTGAEEEVSEEIPKSAPILNHLLASWTLHHGHLVSQEMIAALQKLVLRGISLGERREDIVKKGAELVLKGRVTPDEQHGSPDAAQEGDVMKLMERRGLTLAPLQTPEQPSPVDDTTRMFLQGITAPSPAGRSLWDDFEEALTSPPSPVSPTEEEFSPELEGWFQDTSAHQQIDSTLPPTTADESSEYGSSSTLPSFSDDEAATGHSSESLSPPGVIANRKDGTPGGEQIEEPPHSTD